MKTIRRCALVLASVVASACQEELTPELDLSGHWRIEHGLYQGCQVTATFSDDTLIFSVYNLPEANCSTPPFNENVIIFKLQDRDDYFTDDGARAVDLEVIRSQEDIAATATLWETGSGLSGAISALQDGTGQLDALLGSDYRLTLLAQDWLPDLLGRWGAPCEELDGGAPGEFCELIEFNDTTRGRGYVRGGACTTTSPGGEPACADNSGWQPFTYALRNVEQSGDQAFTLDMFLVMQTEYADTVPLVLNVSPEGLSVTFEGGDGGPETLELLPMTNL